MGNSAHRAFSIAGLFAVLGLAACAAGGGPSGNSLPATTNATARGDVARTDWGNRGGGQGGGQGSGQQWQPDQPWWPGSGNPPWGGQGSQCGPWQQNAGESVFYPFPNAGDGQFADSPVTLAWSGNMYGTTVTGGTSNGGVAYKLSPSQNGQWGGHQWGGGSQCGYQETVIYNFSSSNAVGATPGPLTMDWHGNLWGQTENGIFELTQTGQSTWSANLVFKCSSGRVPFSKIITMSGGSLFVACRESIVVITPTSGGATVNRIYEFHGPNGFVPNGALIVDYSGNIYGTTRQGGTNDDGLAYILSPGSSGYTENIVYEFNGPTSGKHPSSVILDRNGNMYGSTATGGPSHWGTIFELSPNGAGGYAYSLLDAVTNGREPLDTPLMDAWGSLYFATFQNPAGGGNGALLKLQATSTGYQEQLIYSFKGGSDASAPYGTMLWNDWAGNIYGASSAGGGGSCANGCGTLWQYGTQGSHGGGWGQGGWGNGWGYCGGNGNNYGQNNGWQHW